MLSGKNGVVELILPGETIFMLVTDPARQRHP
jgi:hypothetical protein